MSILPYILNTTFMRMLTFAQSGLSTVARFPSPRAFLKVVKGHSALGVLHHNALNTDLKGGNSKKHLRIFSNANKTNGSISIKYMISWTVEIKEIHKWTVS